MELNELQPQTAPAQISFDKEKLVEFISSTAAKYENIVFDESQIKEAKKDRQDINKLLKSANEWAVKVEKELVAPVKAFREEFKEMLKPLSLVGENIDAQVKNFEAAQKQEKEEELKKLVSDLVAAAGITLEIPIQAAWLNTAATKKKTRLEIQAIISAELDRLKNIEFVNKARKERLQMIEETVTRLNGELAVNLPLADFMTDKYASLEIALTEALEKIKETFTVELEKLPPVIEPQVEAFPQIEQAPPTAENIAQNWQAPPVATSAPAFTENGQQYDSITGEIFPQVEQDIFIAPTSNIPPSSIPSPLPIVKTVRLTYYDQHKDILQALFRDLRLQGVAAEII